MHSLSEKQQQQKKRPRDKIILWIYDYTLALVTDNRYANATMNYKGKF